MERGSERRQYGRLNLLAHGRGRVCTLEFEGGPWQAELIDISAGGARIRCATVLGAEVRRLVFSVNSVDDKGLLQRLESSIRWRNEHECGLQFETQLEVGLHTLQGIVS